MSTPEISEYVVEISENAVTWSDLEYLLAEAEEVSRAVPPDIIEVLYRWESEPIPDSEYDWHQDGRWAAVAVAQGESYPFATWGCDEWVMYAAQYREIDRYAYAIDVVGQCLLHLGEQTDLLRRYEQEFGDKADFESRRFWERHLGLRRDSASPQRQ